MERDISPSRNLATRGYDGGVVGPESRETQSWLAELQQLLNHTTSSYTQSMDPFTPGYEGFRGIPKRTLPDDTILYSIYILAGAQSSANLRARLETVKDAAGHLLQEWGKDYLWQREGFALEVSEFEGKLPCQRVEYQKLIQESLQVYRI